MVLEKELLPFLTWLLGYPWTDAQVVLQSCAVPFLLTAAGAGRARAGGRLPDRAGAARAAEGGRHHLPRRRQRLLASCSALRRAACGRSPGWRSRNRSAAA